jgi:CubicO group peptidase (beta-lactamase class C family)
MSAFVRRSDGSVETFHCGTRADAQSGPPNDRTAYRIGSLTKLFTGLAVLTLRDDGQLTLDDPLERFLPEASRMQRADPSFPPVTLRHIVTHTSGLPRIGGLNYARPSPCVTEAEVLADIPSLRVVTCPGTKESYSNVAVALLGIAIGRAAGMRYRDFLTTRILAPLGMTDSVWDARDVPPTRLAFGHDAFEAELPPDRTWNLGAMEAMGGLYSSARDLGIFANYQITCATETCDDGPIRAASVRESQKRLFPSVSTFGVNWMVLEDPALGRVLGHTGALDDFSASIRVLLDRKVAVATLLGISSPSSLDKETTDLARKASSA